MSSTPTPNSRVPNSSVAHLLAGLYMFLAGAAAIQAFHVSAVLGHVAWGAAAMAFLCAHVITSARHDEQVNASVTAIWSKAMKDAIDMTVERLGPIRITDRGVITRDSLIELLVRYKARHGTSPRAFLISRDGAHYILKLCFPNEARIPGPTDKLLGIPVITHYSRSHPLVELV